MKQALITGVRGFAGSWLAAELLNHNYQVQGIDISSAPVQNKAAARTLDDPAELAQIPVHASRLDDIMAVEDLLAGVQGGTIFHLAGTAFVPDTWHSPLQTLENNALVTVRLLEAARNTGWQGNFVFASSSDVYGNPDRQAMPLTEESPLLPESPYARTKLVSEQFLPFYCSDSLQTMIARPFNHSGPGQRDVFVIPAFIKRVREAIIDRHSSIVVGDLNATRDFSDVRDVARAYRIIAEQGESGEIYNICSGHQTSIKELIDTVQAVACSQLELQVDPELLRPEGSSQRFGDSTRLQKLGWAPQYTLRDTIEALWDD
ncbi:MAG: GDP-mannose 4,6-dehydratase [Leptospiraceae bacterium]|nr:GDP-mannose 4,6-dehydratase [Leptospiraceae bacterium]